MGDIKVIDHRKERPRGRGLGVYEAIAQVQAGIARGGIAKDRKNTQQGYSFRGIDDIYNALASRLAEAGLCILPNVLEREVTERATQKGGVLFYVVVKVDFAFVAASDGSEHHIIMYGEAMDSADKATNKAMSAAYKYACLQAFCIPTEGDNDADAQTPQPAAHITAEQYATLEALIETTQTDPANFCRFFKVADVSALPVPEYEKAVAMLKKKVGA